MTKLTSEFWENKYTKNQIGWDLGAVSTPLKNYIDQLEDVSLKILIPGGGNSYEAEYLHNKGFKNVYVVDISKTALENIKKRVPTFPKEHLILQNFFDMKGSFNIILEQTFFCALEPSLRKFYAKKMHELLQQNGKLVGVLFNIPLNTEHPPFGGNKSEYEAYFTPYFKIQLMDACYNSVESRKNNELFIKLVKK